MPLNKKIPVPIEVGGSSNNFSGEITKINQLVANTNRSTSENVSWQSPTSGVQYNTADPAYSSITGVANNGETGLYNLLIYLYGHRNNQWIVTADDYNEVVDYINDISADTNPTAVPVANKLGTSNVGSATTPIYLNGGVPTPVTSLGVNAATATNASYATKIGTSSSHPGIGSATQPVYVDSDGNIIAGTAYSNASVANATKLATARSLKVALGSTTGVTFDGSADQNSIPVSGVLGIANGGTGINSNPSPNYVFAGAASGSTATVPSWRALVADDIPALPSSKIASGTLSVAQGGTGATTFNSNAVLLGNAANAIKTKASASGAFYATGANAEPVFGTLPVAQGGTGQTDLANVTVGNATLAANATKLNTARNIALTGAVSGTASFDGSSNISIATTALNAIYYDSNTNVPSAPSNSIGKNGDVYIVYEDTSS